MIEIQKGTKLAAMFSLGCGNLSRDESKNSVIVNFLRNPSEGNEKPAREVMSGLSTLFPYISLIGECTNLDPFDYRVVSAYFIGSEILEEVPFSASEKLVKKLCRNKPPTISDNFRVTHNFYVFCVSPYVKERQSLLSFIDLCRISTGEVLSLSEEKEGICVANVRHRSLINKSGSIVVGDEKEEKMICDKTITNKVEEGQMVAVHWRRIVKTINRSELKNLDHYTKKAVKCL